MRGEGRRGKKREGRKEEARLVPSATLTQNQAPFGTRKARGEEKRRSLALLAASMQQFKRFRIGQDKKKEGGLHFFL